MSSLHLFIYKAVMRFKLRSAVQAIPLERRKAKSRVITKRLIHSPAFRKAKNILIYVSLAGEVETEFLIRRALALKKNVFAPRVNPASRQIKAVGLADPAKDLRQGAYGIHEPSGLEFPPAKLDLVVVPGMAFDARGGRLGRGLGYFDRFLKKAPSAKKIGIAFREQLIKRVPEEKHDVRVHAVITD